METIIHTTNVIKVETPTLIKITSRIGLGTDDEPIRHIIEYYDINGQLLWRDDSWQELKKFKWGRAKAGSAE